MNASLPPCKTLILVPTQTELGFIDSAASSIPSSCRLEICGFGPIIAASRASQLLVEHKPQNVILFGIAGVYGNQRTIGEALEFNQVACHGIGTGQGARFRSNSEMGWPQWPGNAENPKIIDSIDLKTGRSDAKLLTVCCASGNLQEAAQRSTQFSGSVAEDMEGFGVASACHFNQTPLRIIRGISNQAGDRDHSNWKTQAAVNAAWQMVLQIVQS